jgi:glyoxylase-like metal-dependent hydrolase (beta-lactamase superfamily II)
MSKLRTCRLPVFVLLACLGLPVMAQAAPQGLELQKVAFEAQPARLGDFKLLSLHNAQLVVPNDANTFGVGQSPEDVAAVLASHGVPQDHITVSINVLYASNGKQNYLFDTGIPAGAGGNLLQNLAAHRIKPAGITDIFITHSHFDHIGGLLTKQGEPSFPNARIHMSAKEWAFLQDDEKQGDLVAKIAPQIVAFDKDGEVAPGVTAFDLPGHTPGHVGYVLTSKGKTITDIGDLAHSYVISLAKPDWVVGFDGDADTGKETRRAELTQLAQAHSRIFSTHFPYPGFGTVKADGDGFAWQSTK